MRRTSDIIETGDLYAEPGSHAWAAALRMELWRLLDSADTDHNGLNRFLDTLCEFEGWRQLPSSKGQPFASFAEFCLDRRPSGLGVSAEMVRKWCERFQWARAAQQLAVDPAVKPLGTDGGNRIKDKEGSELQCNSGQGNSSNYLVRRLKRDAPEVAEALARGEYPSARAAAIAAGVVKVPTPLDLGKRAWAKMSRAERKEFDRWRETPEANP